MLRSGSELIRFLIISPFTVVGFRTHMLRLADSYYAMAPGRQITISNDNFLNTVYFHCQLNAVNITDKV